MQLYKKWSTFLADSNMDLLDLLSLFVFIYLFTVMVSQVLATCEAHIYIYMSLLCYTLKQNWMFYLLSASCMIFPVHYCQNSVLRCNFRVPWQYSSLQHNAYDHIPAVWQKALCWFLPDVIFERLFWCEQGSPTEQWYVTVWLCECMPVYVRQRGDIYLAAF